MVAKYYSRCVLERKACRRKVRHPHPRQCENRRPRLVCFVNSVSVCGTDPKNRVVKVTDKKKREESILRINNEAPNLTGGVRLHCRTPGAVWISFLETLLVNVTNEVNEPVHVQLLVIVERHVTTVGTI